MRCILSDLMRVVHRSVTADLLGGSFPVPASALRPPLLDALSCKASAISLRANSSAYVEANLFSEATSMFYRIRSWRSKVLYARSLELCYGCTCSGHETVSKLAASTSKMPYKRGMQVISLKSDQEINSGEHCDIITWSNDTLYCSDRSYACQV
jgi:hypothetical protein